MKGQKFSLSLCYDACNIVLKSISWNVSALVSMTNFEHQVESTWNLARENQISMAASGSIELFIFQVNCV